MTPSRLTFDNSVRALTLLNLIVLLLAGSYLAHAGVNFVVISNTGEVSPLYEVTASSGSAADIQIAVDQVSAVAERGKVHIPAGTFNFVNVGQAWRTVNVPAGIDILGAPTQRDANDQVVQWQTVLIMPYDVPGDWSNAPAWFKIGDGSQDPTKPTRFSDIKLQGYRSINAGSITLHRGIDVYGVINFRIDHVMFEHTAGGGVNIQPWYSWNLYTCGVIDHCKFVNYHGFDNLASYGTGNIGYGVRVARAYDGVVFDPTMTVLGHYTKYTVFIEDCYFSKWRHCVASDHGGYYVFRHNIIDKDFAHYSLDVHGLRDLEVGRAGGRGCEVYENVFQNVETTDEDPYPPYGGVMQTGGGCGVFFNNMIDNTYGWLMLYSEEVASETWHLKDFYMWSNQGTWQPNVDYYPSPIGASRNVVETWSRVAGDESDANYPNVDPTWSIAGYKPYPYPHPLTIG